MTDRNRDGLGLKVENECEKELGDPGHTMRWGLLGMEVCWEEGVLKIGISRTKKYI